MRFWVSQGCPVSCPTISLINCTKDISGLVMKATLYLSWERLSRISLRERVLPSPTSPMMTAMHSLPSSMANNVSAIVFSTEACDSTYIEGSGTLSNGGFFRPQYSKYIVSPFCPSLCAFAEMGKNVFQRKTSQSADFVTLELACFDQSAKESPAYL